MPIDPLSEELLTMSQAAALLPKRRGGSRVAITTLWRWRTRGSKGVRLATVRVGGCVYTTAAALRDFIESQQSGTAAALPAAESPSRRSRRAMAELERMGL